MKFINYFILYLVFLVLAFPLFYFVYKYGDPEPLAHDFFQYYYLYKDFDIAHVIAPHNMRIAGSFFVYLFYKANVFYDTVSAFDKYESWGFLKQVYFDALLFNFLCVAATCVLLFRIFKNWFHDLLFSFTGSLLYLLGFGTLFYELMPLTDSFSVLLFTLTFYLYLEKRYSVVIPLVILIFQREYILIALGTWALMDFIKVKNKYDIYVFLGCTLCFTVHVLLRKTVFYTSHLDFQSSIEFMRNSIFKNNFDIWTYLKQLAMTLNLFYLYLGVIIYKKYNGLTIDGFSCIKILLLFLQINLICHVAGHGNNCGRYFYMLTPLVIFLLVKEFEPLFLRGRGNHGSMSALRL